MYPLAEGEVKASWSDNALLALASPLGSDHAIAELHLRYIQGWRDRFVRLGGINSGHDYLARCANLPSSRFCDPVALLWLNRLIHQLDKLCDSGHSLSTLYDNALIGLDAEPNRPRIAGGSIILFGLNECEAFSPSRRSNEGGSLLSPAEIEAQVIEALNLLGTVWPEAQHDAKHFFRGLVAVESPPGHYSSGSSALFPYVLKLTVKQGSWPVLLADAIVHETAHVKLRCAMQFDSFLVSDDTLLYRHPWRPDLRPLRGVFVATHAFLSVLQFYVCLVEQDIFENRTWSQAIQLSDEVRVALNILDGASGLTSLGRRFYQVLRRQSELSNERLVRAGQLRNTRCPGR